MFICSYSTGCQWFYCYRMSVFDLKWFNWCSGKLCDLWSMNLFYVKMNLPLILLDMFASWQLCALINCSVNWFYEIKKKNIFQGRRLECETHWFNLPTEGVPIGKELILKMLSLTFPATNSGLVRYTQSFQPWHIWQREWSCYCWALGFIGLWKL